MKWAKRSFGVLAAAVITGCCMTAPQSAAAAQQISAETRAFYQQWKNKYVVQDKYVTDAVQYYVYYSEEHYQGGNQSVAVTVSEAHGYGMLAMVHMAPYDASAQAYFDGMFRYFRAHPSDIGTHLMSWQQCDNGTALIDGANDGAMEGGFCDSATDGDMDIAYALLAADAVWGSDGAINYRAEALAVLSDIMQYDINQTYWTINLGDWVSECGPGDPYYGATRCSDFFMQALPVFAEATGDDNWMKVYDATYAIIHDMVAAYGTGILPDFVIRQSDGTYVPAPANFLESEHDGHYYYNSCRTPWRIGMDALLNHHADALRFSQAINDFMKTTTNGDPWEVMAGYTLDGTAFGDYNDLCFVAPLLISAACDTDSTWHDAIREVLLAYGDDVYYGDTIKLLCMIIDDGGWLIPSVPSTIRMMGDVNADGSVRLADVVMMQKWLLGDGGLTDWKAGDFNADGQIDTRDLSLLKRALLLP